jgi:biotin carboxylase
MHRVLLLLPTSTYKTGAYLTAAARLGMEIVVASEQPSTLAAKNPEGLLTLDFTDPEKSARAVASFAARYPIDAVIPVDEDTAVVGAHIAHALGLDQNPVPGAEAARNKYLMRQALRQAALPVPEYWHFTLDDDLNRVAARVGYPCVVKPVFLSTSRGVIRADNSSEFLSAVGRINQILSMPSIRRRGGSAARQLIAEEFIPGVEIALEGLLDKDALKVLAIFDKPDPLNGPFFEETIYVTPSRLPDSVQARATEGTLAAARAMGLVRGPLHAELRINEKGPYVIEVAARAIGGLCSRSLRFGQDLGPEELILMHAVGMDTWTIERERRASGVMMIPIPRGGVLCAVNGLAEARAVPSIDDIIITAHITQEIVPPPEGASYLGFIFSRADTPDAVASALRAADGKLEFVIEPKESNTGKASDQVGNETLLRSV